MGVTLGRAVEGTTVGAVVGIWEGIAVGSYEHTATGTSRVLTVDKQSAAQTTPTFPPPDTSNDVRSVNAHSSEGTAPTQ